MPGRHLSYDKSAAVVVMPAVGNGRLGDRKLRRWLARAALEETGAGRGLLDSVLGELGMTTPGEGVAAMRMWGQTGDRPAVWIAAADPVYLEPQLDRLRLHALHRGEVAASEVGTLFDHLQRALGDGAGYGFAQLGSRGYVRTETPLATATVPAEAVDGLEPGDFLPPGSAAASFRNLQSEIEMALHDHEVNIERGLRGEMPVNSLWLWGGGCAPEQRAVPHPPLFADDPLLRGYWLANTGVVEHWPGTIAACLDASVAGFVAVMPDTAESADAMASCLGELRDALASGRLSRLTLLFRDGIRAGVERSDGLRVWRRRSSLLEDADG